MQTLPLLLAIGIHHRLKMVAKCWTSIFRIREEEINFHSFLKFSALIFRFFFWSFEPLGDDASFKQKFAHTARIFYFRFVFFTLGVAIVSFVTFGVTHLDNFFLATSSVPNANCILLILLKGLSTFMHRKDIWLICHELNDLLNERIISSNKSRSLKKYLDEYHRVIRIYSVPFIVVSIPIVFPLFPFIFHGDMDLPILYWYPIDMYRAEVFPLALIWVNWIAWNASMMLLAVDSLLFALISVIAMEFDILRDDIAMLSSTAEDERMKKIQSLTDRHNKLLSFVDKLQSIYGLMFLYCFVISSLIICFIAFQMSTATNFGEGYMFNAPYLGMMVAQVFLLCFSGQKLIDSSLGVADGAYNCGWENINDIKLKKTLILIILRSQRPKRLTAMNFAEISLPSFTTVRGTSIVTT